MRGLGCSGPRTARIRVGAVACALTAPPQGEQYQAAAEQARQHGHGELPRAQLCQRGLVAVVHERQRF